MMGPEIEMSAELKTIMDVSPGNIKENRNSIELSEEKLVVCSSNCEDHDFVYSAAKASDGNLMMTCTSSYEDNSFHDCDQIMASKECNEDVVVDIVENVIPEEDIVAERESLDATENSSSFGCTDSGAGTAGASSDVEVESQMRDDNASLMDFDGFNDIFRTRKKKLTAHWRKFIRPLMWRCKWVELHIRELRSQTSKYGRELEECGKRKQYEPDKSAAEDLAMKSAPFVCQNRAVRIMKRKKRKKVEEIADLAAYSSSHSLFSYFANKKPSGDSAYLGDDRGNTEKTTSCIGEFGVTGEWSFLEFKDRDACENILRSIEVAQLHVRQLKLRIDKVIKENAENFTSENSSIVDLGELLANCGPSSYIPPVNGENSPLGSLLTTSQQTSQKKTVMPTSVVSGHTEVYKIENEILVYSQPVKEELNNTEAVGTQHTAETQSGIEAKVENVEHIPDPDSPSKLLVTREQASVKVRPKLIITPKNKKKRGKRKARAGRWSKKSSE